MAAKDVITRFKLETTQYDSKIKEAARELSDYSKTATQAKEGFNQFTKANVEAAKALGTMATSATNVKDRTKELVSAFNSAAKAYNSLTKDQKQSDWAQALAGSLTQLQQRIKETKAEMQGIGNGMKNVGGGGGGIFSGLGDKMSGALAVFGGNLMTKAAGAVAQLGSEMADMVKQGVEMAKAGEGVRIAFERLGNGQILDGLREATHGTVTDIELMKAAVKFNDFKLPIEELGTMLAFAQQKAKDTGQSVDYMVDSIVTGLGRKSTQILDNLGLSQAEVKERTKETGDMTKAVGAIIREQMAKAGDYVETAADRAAQANVTLQNKMEELGRKFGPVEEASNQLWTSMKIGILDVVGGPLARLLNGLTEAGRLKNMLNDLNGKGSDGQTHTERVLGMLRHYSGGGRGIEGKRDLYNRQVSLYIKQEEKAWREANRLREEYKGLKKQQDNGQFQGAAGKIVTDKLRELEQAENRAKSFQILRANYQAGAKTILNPQTSSPAGTIPVGGGRSTKPVGGGRSTKTTPPPPEGSIDAQRLEVQKLEKAWNRAATDALRDKYLSALKDARKELDRMTGKTPLEGSIDAQAKKVSELQAAWRAAADDDSRKRISSQIAEAEQRLDELMGKTSQVQGISITNQSGMTEYINMLQQQLSKADYGSAIYQSLSAQLTDMTTLQTLVGESLKLGLGTAMFDVADELGMDFWTRAMEGGVENVDWKSILDKLNEKRKEMGLDQLTLDYDTGTFSNKDTSKKGGLAQADKMVSGLASVSSGLQQMGIQLPDGVTKLLGAAQGLMTIIQAVNSVITLFSTTTATAQVTASTANTAATTGLIAAVEANTFALTAKSFLPGIFANGGIVGHAAGGYFVPGNRYSGDTTPILANAGEVVLNRAQTGVLASALSEQSAPATSTPYVSGEKIYLGMENYLKRIGRGEIVTSRH